MLDGFEDGYAEVNGTRLHYVVGGAGEPLVPMALTPEELATLSVISSHILERLDSEPS